MRSKLMLGLALGTMPVLAAIAQVGAMKQETMPDNGFDIENAANGADENAANETDPGMPDDVIANSPTDASDEVANGSDGPPPTPDQPRR